MIQRCEGIPYHECGRPVAGLERWCLIHGTAEERNDRWEMHRNPIPRLREAATPVATERELQAALQGELAL